MVRKQILDTIDRYELIQPNQHIVLGLSGGPDSVCLFHVLLEASSEAGRGWTIHPVHINHKLRPGAAEADQAYVENLCRASGCPCRTFVCDCNAIAKAEKMTSEEAGRKARYETFAAVAEELEKSGIPRENICIAVAQNADDQAETILFRLLRGAGVDGLSGIRYMRTDEKGYRVVRPLLDVKREDILEYCSSHDLSPCMDHTNEEAVYTRNKIRLRLIPYLQQEYNPAIKDTMIRLGKNARDDSDYLWEQADIAYEKAVISKEKDEILLKGDELRGCHRAVRFRVLAKAFSDLGLSEDVSAVHFQNCEDIVFHRHPSARCPLPKGYYLARVYDDVKAGKEAAEERTLPQLKVSILDLAEYRQKKLQKDSHGAFDADQLKAAFGEDFVNRIAPGYRGSGDFISVGENQSKKIQDYFVDRKIPKDERDAVPMVKIGREVLWILPYGGKGRFTSKYKVCENTKKVICIEIIC